LPSNFNHFVQVEDWSNADVSYGEKERRMVAKQRGKLQEEDSKFGEWMGCEDEEDKRWQPC